MLDGTSVGTSVGISVGVSVDGADVSVGGGRVAVGETGWAPLPQADSRKINTSKKIFVRWVFIWRDIVFLLVCHPERQRRVYDTIRDSHLHLRAVQVSLRSHRPDVLRENDIT